MKKCGWLKVVSALVVILAVLGHPSSASLAADPRQAGDISFRWAFGALTGPPGNRQLVSITRDMPLKTGDEIKILIEIKKKCFAYVFYLSSKEELFLLFPFQEFSAEHKALSRYYIPQGNLWFELDENTGPERFYLLASAQPLTELESLYGQYRSSSNPQEGMELAKRIIAAIKEIRKRHERLTRPAEYPTRLAGSIRGIKGDRPDLDQIAVEISATNFFSRTFTIDHR